MPRRPADAFGLSLLDVLSNALGGTMLLMMIVAASVGGIGNQKENLPVEGATGEFMTEPEEFERRPPQDKLSLLVIQVRFWGGTPGADSLYFDPNSFPPKSSSVSYGISDQSQWLVMKKEPLKKDLVVILETESNHLMPDSVSIFATLDAHPLCSCRDRIPDINRSNYELLRISEDSSEKPNIYLFGEKCEKR